LKPQLPIGDGDFTHYNASKRSGQWEVTYSSPYSYGEECWFILNDGGFPSSQTRARLYEAYCKLQGKPYVYYIRTTVADTQALLQSNEFKGANYLLLSSISAKDLKNIKKTFKDKEKVFKWSGGATFPYSSNWTSIDAPDKMVYVNIDCFKPVGFRWEELKQIKNLLDCLGHKIDIYGVKSGGKIEDGAVNLKDYLLDLATEFAQKDEYIKNTVDTALFAKINSNFFTKNVLNGWFATVVNDVECPDAKRIMQISYSNKKDSTFNNMYAIVNYARKSGHSKLEKALEHIQTKINQEYLDMSNCVERCINTYPLLNGFGASYYTNINHNDAKNLVDYVNVVYRYNAGV
jgi:hypothetical protein